MTPTSYLYDHSIKARRFAVLGGDGRMTYLAERLSEAGCSVSLLGCGSDGLPADAQGDSARLCTTLAKAAEGATALILPLPATRDGRTVWCPRDPACIITFEEIRDLLDRRPELYVFGGRLPAGFASPAASDRAVDYYHSEALQLRNAYITAEAAMMKAMELTDCTLQGSTVAIIGYGRIGKFLVRLLRAIGADVTVCARREESLLWAATEGCRPLSLTGVDRTDKGLYGLCRGHRVIFNTVPEHILDRERLLRTDKNTLLIDLASAPFGVADEDVREAAAVNGLRYVRAPSLPGSYAPRDAGRIIAACVLDHLQQVAVIH